MSKEENKELLLRWYEAWSKGDSSLFDELYSSSYRYYFQAGEIWEREKTKTFYEKVIREGPDRMTLTDIMAEGDRVSVWLSCNGGLTAKGGLIRNLIHKFADGKIVETRQGCIQKADQ